MKEILTRFLNVLGQAYWVKIETKQPSCTYYFGPFLKAKDAQSAQAGYLEDLSQEGASNIVVNIKRCKPTELTVVEDKEESIEFASVPAFGTQS